jgi:hypothetical protein
MKKLKNILFSSIRPIMLFRLAFESLRGKGKESQKRITAEQSACRAETTALGDSWNANMKACLEIEETGEVIEGAGKDFNHQCGDLIAKIHMRFLDNEGRIPNCRIYSSIEKKFI